VVLPHLQPGQCALRSALVRREKPCRKTYLFPWATTLPLLARSETHPRYVRGKRKSRLTPIPRCGHLAAAWLAALRVRSALARTPVLLLQSGRQAVESQPERPNGVNSLGKCSLARYPKL